MEDYRNAEREVFGSTSAPDGVRSCLEAAYPAIRSKVLEEVEAQLRERAEHYARKYADCRAREKRDHASGALSKGNTYTATWSFYEGKQNAYEHAISLLDSDSQPDSEDRGWCPKCQKSITPTLVDECPDCGSFQFTGDPSSRASAYPQPSPRCWGKRYIAVELAEGAAVNRVPCSGCPDCKPAPSEPQGDGDWSPVTLVREPGGRPELPEPLKESKAGKWEYHDYVPAPPEPVYSRGEIVGPDAVEALAARLYERYCEIPAPGALIEENPGARERWLAEARADLTAVQAAAFPTQQEGSR